MEPDIYVYKVDIGSEQYLVMDEDSALLYDNPYTQVTIVSVPIQRVMEYVSLKEDAQKVREESRSKLQEL